MASPEKASDCIQNDSVNKGPAIGFCDSPNSSFPKGYDDAQLRKIASRHAANPTAFGMGFATSPEKASNSIQKQKVFIRVSQLYFAIHQIAVSKGNNCFRTSRNRIKIYWKPSALWNGFATSPDKASGTFKTTMLIWMSPFDSGVPKT